MFEGVGIATAILISRKKNGDINPGPTDVVQFAVESDDFIIPSFEYLNDVKTQTSFSVNLEDFRGRPWNLSGSTPKTIYEKIDGAGEPLGFRIAVLGQGMQTGRNDVFELDDAEARALRTDAAQCLKRRARNSDIEAFHVATSLNFVLYVEDYPNFASLPVRVQRYLTKHRRGLEERAAFIRGDCVWWKYSWPRNKEMYNRSRLICPYRATKNRFAVADDETISLTDTTCVFVNDFEEGADYLIGLLNSAVLTFRFFGLGKLTGKKMYEYFDNAVAKLPIRRIAFDNVEDVRETRPNCSSIKNYQRRKSNSLPRLAVLSERASPDRWIMRSIGWTARPASYMG